MALKDSDARMLKYFYEEKGDMKRYVGFSELESQLNEEYNLQHYLNQIEEAEASLVRLLDQILYESEDDYE